MTVKRQVYVISDLHIGGSYPDPAAAIPERKRGFRMMTRAKELKQFIDLLTALPADPAVELVINGDFVDFLAEEKGSGGVIDPEASPEWTAFRFAHEEALEAFKEVVARDAQVFDALRSYVAAGKRLTIVIGNHDIELSLPDVRAELVRLLGPGRVTFLDDGQALDLGDVLIDHGNVFDPANAVDHDRLRGLRATYSRGWFEHLEKAFSPPAGSQLVASVMNPIKLMYGFVDLLKPESEALIALLLAIEPGYRNSLEAAAKALANAAKSYVPRRGVPWILRNVSDDSSAEPEPTSDLDTLLAAVLADSPEVAAALQQAGLEPETQQVEVAGGFIAKWSLFRLLIGEEEGDLLSRIPQVQGTLRALTEDYSFDPKRENARYLEAAEWLAAQSEDQKGYKIVIFGHTHHAKDVALEDVGARYLNTGTWANLMKFPPAFTDATKTTEEIREALVEFAENLKDNKLEPYLVFEPTYVRIDLGGDDKLVAAELKTYDWKKEKL